MSDYTKHWGGRDMPKHEFDRRVFLIHSVLNFMESGKKTPWLVDAMSDICLIADPDATKDVWADIFLCPCCGLPAGDGDNCKYCGARVHHG